MEIKLTDAPLLPFDAPAPRLADEDARERALDTRESFIVQAPAGSGKTELLTSRFLELLAQVQEPEEILAITFTRAATAEMRSRVLRALEQAREAPASAKASSRLAAAARAALHADTQRGWKLLELPQRLNIQTIDSLCLSIAQQAPLLSRLGGTLAPVDDATPLYAEAARRTLARLGGKDADLNAAISSLLELRETSLSNCEHLIAGMLAQRDQWGRVLPLGREPDWQEFRETLESPFREEYRRSVARIQHLFAQDAALTQGIFALLEYACRNLADAGISPVLALQGISTIQQMKEHRHWLGLCGFLLTKSGSCRATANVRLGFPPAANGNGKAERRQQNDRFKTLLTALSSKAELLKHLCAIRELPPLVYSEEQWRMLRHALLILYYAMAELRVIFAERSQMDFVELGLAAATVLHNETDRLPADLAMRWPHLLVDEFQDTSRAQYDLFSLLVEAREEPGTCFFVGDPMQSIYGFRQAEVELFEGARRRGLGDHSWRFPLTPLGLQMNFRSHAGLVEPLNGIFDRIFSSATPQGCYSVAFSPSVANDSTPLGTPSVHVEAQFLPPKANREEKLAAHQAEAARAVEIVQKHWPQVEAAAQAGGAFRIAVLARAKKHLWLIAEKMREAGIPYKAVEIENLAERQEVLDASSLVRALSHPMDRIAWLSVLRAPWCGLTLQDLHLLCGSDDRQLAGQPLLQLLRMRTGLLADDGKQRATRVLAALEAAMAGKHSHLSFAQWAERTWLTLGGRDCVDRAGYENVRTFFCMLEETGPEDLDRHLARLYAAPDPEANERYGVQLMTIHKAKGLEFEVVLVPGLQKAPGSADPPLLSWLERTTLEGPEENERREFLVAPIGRKNADADPHYRWIGRQKRRLEREEAKRLLYVACTRASKELYLMGTANVSTEASGAESLKPGNGAALLATAWPGVQDLFLAEYEKQRNRPAAASTLSTPKAGTETRVGTAVPLGKLRRLPLQWRYPGAPEDHLAADHPGAVESAAPSVGFERPAGSLQARAVGAVAHALLEELAHLARPTPEVAGGVDRWRPRAVAMLRQAGLSREQAELQSSTVIRALKSALEDPVGRWMLSARSDAETETSWSAWQTDKEQAEALSTRRADRIFRAGAQPLSLEETHLWIVDYKTAQHSDAGLDAFLKAEEERYKPQLELYGRMLRETRNKMACGEALPLRLALYYPLLKRLLCWDG